MSYIPHMITHTNIEDMNPTYAMALCQDARERTWDAVEAISKLIKPGMSEQEAIRIANQYLASQGVRKFWHRTHIRFGQNTILGFNDEYEDDVFLKENDIFNIDIGPIWDGVEGDCGKAFVVGNCPKKKAIAKAAETIFQSTRTHWHKTGASGHMLQSYAESLAHKMGYVLHPTYVKGHRLSEFPHKIYSRDSLFDLTFCPAPERWVLEIHICDPSMAYGAFFEDLLM